MLDGVEEPRVAGVGAPGALEPTFGGVRVAEAELREPSVERVARLVTLGLVGERRLEGPELGRCGRQAPLVEGFEGSAEPASAPEQPKSDEPGKQDA